MSIATAKKEKKKEDQANDLPIQRHFTKEGEDFFTAIKFVKRKSKIAEPDGKVVFEMDEVEVPESWSQLATDIIVSKYFRKAGVPGTGNEVSAKQVVHRLSHTIRIEGEKQGYFSDKQTADIFEDELKFLLIGQYGAFNSPTWFNLGLFHEYGIIGGGGNWAWDESSRTYKETLNSYERPQCAACFIQSVDDSLDSIFELAAKEARLFKFGSGTGSNFSKIRSKYEKLSGGGTSSGLLSFLEVLDRGAGATKSGGTTRRAAKMVSLEMDHPEIEDFIEWKAKEEAKAKILIEAGGYPADFNGEAYSTVSGQNSNNSVRASDEFMKAIEKDKEWKTTLRTTGEVHKVYKARDLFRKISQSAWICADPGMQFDTTINSWHTCPDTAPIHGSNPCSEFMFIDDTACNLASLNLMKFWKSYRKFDIEGFRAAIRIFSIAQEILVDLASYPTKTVTKNSHEFRPLGLGYANLGTLLMVNGLPYDSDEGRAMATAITAIMTGHAYKTSAEIASIKGAFDGFAQNKESMLKVIRKHRHSLDNAYQWEEASELFRAAGEDWDQALSLGKKYGFRNAQMTVLAPTGTIGLLMDCDTTGVEPDFSLVKWKKLAGGGYFKIVNQSMPLTLENLGYTPNQVKDIIRYILGTGTLNNASVAGIENLKSLGFTSTEIQEASESVAASGQFTDFTPGITPSALRQKGVPVEDIDSALKFVNGTGSIEGAPHLKEEDYAVFDCANRCGNGKRFIEPMAHLKMMAAVQPFLSGAISKTVNLPNQTTVEDIEDIYMKAWKMGLKSVALYRDGSKGSQPLNNKSDKKDGKMLSLTPNESDLEWGKRRVLPKKRTGFTLEAKVANHKLFLRTGEYNEGQLGEIFIDMYKEGAAYRSMMNCFAIAVSIGLSYGVPLEKYVDSFTFTRFEPHGFTDHPNIRTCTSLLDFIFRVLGMEYLGRTDFVHQVPEKEKNVLDIVDHSKKDKEPFEAKESGTSKEIKQKTPDDYYQDMMGDAPACDKCGHITVRNGSCYRCLNCGNSMGCS